MTTNKDLALDALDAAEKKAVQMEMRETYMQFYLAKAAIHAVLYVAEVIWTVHQKKN